MSYTSTYGYDTDVDFDGYQFDWSLFTNKITGSTPEDVIDETVRYVTYTAVAVQKDWGTGSYMLSHWGRSNAMENHYGVNTYFYYDYHPMETIRQVVQDQVTAGRPVMMHLRDLAHDSYHAVVVDAWKNEADTFMVHIEMGREGADNGWYDFDAPILQYNDNDYRRIMTVVPGDYDGDFDSDDADIDLFCDAPVDLDGDDDADEDDHIFLVEHYVERSGPGASGLGTKRGDANLDGLVNATDLATLAAGFGQSGMGWSGANFNMDDAVNATDLAILAANFGFEAPTSTVPGPTFAGLMLIGGIGLLRQRRRSRT